jgi:hypothetical protein
MLSVIYAECRYAGCRKQAHCAECRYAECRGANSDDPELPCEGRVQKFNIVCQSYLTSPILVPTLCPVVDSNAIFKSKKISKHFIKLFSELGLVVLSNQH